jgi:putative Mg2+ transporter-C (MgtC) family protein
MIDPNQEIFVGQGDAAHVVRVLLRLGSAVIAGGILGFERELEHKRAGVRTHMLVALGAALFTLLPSEMGLDPTRVIQGIATGIGFIGAGTIFKLTEQQEVRGLTTAAGIWVTAAVGTFMGAGLLWPVLLTVALAWTIMMWLNRLEGWFKQRRPTRIESLERPAKEPGS